MSSPLVYGGTQLGGCLDAYTARRHATLIHPSTRCAPCASRVLGRHGNTSLHHPAARSGAALDCARRNSRSFAKRSSKAPATLAESCLSSSYEWDVLGVGQALIDYSVAVDDQVLAALNVAKGGRRVVSVEERTEAVEFLQEYPSHISAGGSLANTLVAVARLGAVRAAGAAAPPPPLRVAMTGCVGGNDALGAYARAQLAQAGVDVLPSSGQTSNHTGTVMVLSTPDAQRSFLSCFSPEDELHPCPQLEAVVGRARVLLLEGYLLEVPGAARALPRLAAAARRAGALVALTASDAGVVARHQQGVQQLLEVGVDVLFANADEARMLLGCMAGNNAAAAGVVTVSAAPSAPAPASIQEVTTLLSAIARMVVVTDGSRGSYVHAGGQLSVVPPCWLPGTPPVDTCGAGDAYAAGLLYGLLSGLDVPAMGAMGARTASAVISRYGPQLGEDDAWWVAAAAASAAMGAEQQLQPQQQAAASQ